MIKYLLQHRIATVMAFLALTIIGCVTYGTLPVSLLPDIAIPHITVQVAAENVSARELENTATAPLRRQLMQTEGLSEITSRTRDGCAVISMTMNYGVDTDLAFIEVNEKIDAAMNSLPKTMRRPKAMKASATDIPVLFLQLTPSHNSQLNTDSQFIELADVAENIIRRRLEQMPEIAMADITGVPQQIIRITPITEKTSQAGITTEDIENAVSSNNVEPGSMTVKDGHYEYSIHVSNLLRTLDDIRDIRIRKGDRLLCLGDFAEVEASTRQPQGYSLFNGKRAVTIAIIKHSDESMDAMKKALEATVAEFSEKYPYIEFILTRDQTALLDFTISNLEQNLILGLILVLIVCILFMGNALTSVVIGISIAVSVVITFLLFYLFHVSINIISMSGLILAVGMMIDNSVIVTENIQQYRQRGLPLMESCVKGTAEMITPMLSSSLTTVAVFVPLVFMSGIAGSIFSDQAFAITAGLAASYVVGIALLPVIFFLIHNSQCIIHNSNSEKNNSRGQAMFRIYDMAMNFCLRHQVLLITLTLLTIPLCVVLFIRMPKERMPEIDSDETIVRIDWNENITLDENRNRVEKLNIQDKILKIEEVSAFVGAQDYMTGDGKDLATSEAELYFKVSDPSMTEPLQKVIAALIREEYPKATLSFSKADNIFERIFSSDEPNIEARLRYNQGVSDIQELIQLHGRIAKATGEDLDPIPTSQQIELMIDRERLALYNVDYSETERVLKTAFKGTEASTLRSYSRYTPIEISDGEHTVGEAVATLFVSSRPDHQGLRTEIPLRELVRTGRNSGLKTITAGAAGEYIPIALDGTGREKETMTEVRSATEESGSFDVDFAGSFFSNSQIMKEMTVILLVSVMLMYFILCAQFESFVQPLIVLVEIPIDTAFALLTLMACGQTLNLMSAIGIIVTCGIIVNDSILKLDAINELRKEGMPLMEAIHTAGHRRLTAIIMTSLTTIFAMVPTLFTSDMGSELQRPLAIAMIGSMTVGTLVSIFIIPLFYRAIYRRNENN
ncbi:MAG: efflux RND transporter permease subunit [Muribaculaceae bacterium]|nr:efflux RND transporter permease subunit [Muribaculaceae bacterium]